MVKNPPANARVAGLIPAPGRFHMELGNYAQAPPLLKLTHHNLKPGPLDSCSATREATAMRSPCITPRE